MFQINKIVFIYNIQKALWILKPHDKLFIRPVVASPVLLVLTSF